MGISPKSRIGRSLVFNKSFFLNVNYNVAIFVNFTA